MAISVLRLADEKASAPNDPSFEPPTSQQAAESHPFRKLFLRRILPAILTLLAILSLFRTAFVCHHHYVPSLLPIPADIIEGEAGEKVPLEIHVMSKCPDARDCLRELVVPTMIRVNDKVDFTMSFIGR